MYRVEYKVRNFSLDEARRIIHERPQDLNLAEIYMVAGSYEEGSEEYRYAMEVAEKLYAGAPAVRADIALQAIEDGDPIGAVAVLRDRTDADEPELLNILGVAYVKAGMYDNAMVQFSAAAEAGCENARHNIAQLEGLLDQLDTAGK